MNRKAQGMPMNIIIIAAIALVVLIVLIVIFYGKAKTFSASAEDCVQKGGDCYTQENCKGPNLGKMNCPNEKPFCCLKLEE